MTLDSIDWDHIWSIHAPHFEKGLSKIPLKENVFLYLKPGAGFGDLSHPTTKLIFEMMKPLVKDKTVIDIGSGTGILSIAASLLGAKEVYAFEIDTDSILHTKENIALNRLSHKIFVNEPPKNCDLVLLNMISSEQAIALQQYPFLNEHNYTLLTSGILKEERKRYLSSFSSWGVADERKQGSWIAFNLKRPSPQQ